MEGDLLPEVSIVVPLHDEEEMVSALVGEVREALDGRFSWELLLVDDGSTDATASLAEREGSSDPRIRAIHLARNYGQTAALQAGFDHARASVVVSMDGDLQNDPRDIPVVVEKLSEGYDLVTGYRIRRKDPFFTRRLPSWVANRLIRVATGVPIRDTGCPLKAYRKDLLDRIDLYSDLHRFIPAVAATTAAARITEIGVSHRPRRSGRSKYGLGRVARVLADLVVIRTLGAFRTHPLVLFAMAAIAPSLIGLGFAIAALHVSHSEFPGLAGAMIFPGVSAAFIGLAAYLVMLGLVAEVAAERWSSIRRPLPMSSE